jgi:hypothetical protein
MMTRLTMSILQTGLVVMLPHWTGLSVLSLPGRKIAVEQAYERDYREVARDLLHARDVATACEHAVRYDVETRGPAESLADWNRRQLNIAHTVSTVYEVDTLDTLPIVARVFPKLCPRLY